MTDLLSKLQNLQNTKEARGCAAARFLDGLDPDTRELLKFQIEETTTSIRKLQLVIASEGHKLSREAMSAHRSGECICRKEMK